MNKEERKFYEFLISIPEDIFDQWLLAATQDQIDLADRLFDEVKHGNLDEVSDVSDAMTFLKRFTVNGK